MESEILELEQFFNWATLPPAPVQLNSCTVLTNVPIFVKTHLSVVNANKKNPVFLPYLERLKELQTFIKNIK